MYWWQERDAPHLAGAGHEHQRTGFSNDVIYPGQAQIRACQHIPQLLTPGSQGGHRAGACATGSIRRKGRGAHRDTVLLQGRIDFKGL
jgi:hypothetical protein